MAADPVTTAEVNAVFDELWAEREATLASLSWPARGMAEAALTRARILATATACVAAADKARAAVSAALAAATPKPPITTPMPTGK